MRAKQQQLERQLKEDIKQKIKQKKSQLTSHFKVPLPAQKNKTSTYNPSYVRKQQQNYIDMKKNLHLIINKSSFQALRKQVKTATFKQTQTQQKQKPKSSLNPKDMFSNVVTTKPIQQPNCPRVMGCLPNQNSLAQLWALVADQLHDQSYFIYNVQSNLFLKVQSDKVHLAPKQKQKTKQFLFQIIRQTDKSKQFSIYKHSITIKSLLNGRCLLLRGVLCLGDMNMNNQGQQFYLKKVGMYEPKGLRDSMILFNPQDKNKEKAFLSVRRDREELGYDKLDYSLYQRWIFAPSVRSVNNQQHTNLKQQSLKSQKQNQQPKSSMQEKSKFQSLPLAQMELIAKATRNLIKEYDTNLTQMINFKLQKSLSVIQSNGHYEFTFIPKSQQREWRVDSDGYSLKIKHDKTGQYLAIKDDQVVLSKSPFYWQVFETGRNSRDGTIDNRDSLNQERMRLK